jgi:hypothetical protein
MSSIRVTDQPSFGFAILQSTCQDRRLVRTKPYQMDLYDALALTDEDALAKDMFSRPSMQPSPSAYMQARAMHRAAVPRAASGVIKTLSTFIDVCGDRDVYLNGERSAITAEGHRK